MIVQNTCLLKRRKTYYSLNSESLSVPTKTKVAAVLLLVFIVRWAAEGLNEALLLLHTQHIKKNLCRDQ